MSMIYDRARELSQLLASSEEYLEFKRLRDRAMENQATRMLISEYHKLRLKAQAAAVAGSRDEVTLERLKKVGEVLQFDKDASEYLMSEFRINGMLSEIYKILASALDIDLSALEG